MVRSNRHARITMESESIIAVTGDFDYGQVIATEAVDLAIEKASNIGVAVLAIKDCGHLGRIGAWAELVASRGMVSIHFVNTSGFGILVAPFGGSDRRLSANPIAAGVPVKGGEPIILDIATSMIAEVHPVPKIVKSDRPSYSFKTSKSGTLNFSGKCRGNVDNAVVGINHIALLTAEPGAYNNCTMTLTDSSNNISQPLKISSFVVVEGQS